MPGGERHNSLDDDARETQRALPLGGSNEIVGALGIQHRYTLRYRRFEKRLHDDRQILGTPANDENKFEARLTFQQLAEIGEERLSGGGWWKLLGRRDIKHIEFIEEQHWYLPFAKRLVERR